MRRHFLWRSLRYSGVGVLRLSQRETAAHGAGEQRRRTLLVIPAKLHAMIEAELVFAEIAVQILLAAVLIAASRIEAS